MMLAILKRTFAGYAKDRVGDMGATTAYYAIFSLAPLLLVILAILGLFFSQTQGQERLFMELQALLGSDATALIRSMVNAISDLDKSIIGIFLGITLLVLGATGVMMSIQRAFNRIWHIEMIPEKTNFLTTIIKRLFSFGLILCIGFLLVASLLVSILLNVFSEQVSEFLRLPEVVLTVINSGVSFATIWVFFTLLILFLPDVKIPWRSAFAGGLFTTVLFFVGKFVLAWYLGRQSEGSPYGVATALISILLWINYSSQILFLGVEFTKSWTDVRKVKVASRDNARYQKKYHVTLVPTGSVSFFKKITIAFRVVWFEIGAARKALKWKKKLTRSKSTKSE